MIYPIEKRESNRITFLRAICVALVIYIHQYAGDLGEVSFIAAGTLPENSILQAIQYIISREITFVAVPLFFLISSVLLFAKEFTWVSNVKKKAKTLILPYFIWISLYIFIYWLGQTLPVTKDFFENANRQVADMSVIDFIGAYTGIGGALFVNALWFLRDLILLNILAPIIKIFIDKFPMICFILLMILWNIGEVPGILLLNKQSIVFFALGYYVVKYNARMKTIDDHLSIGGVIVYMFTIALEFYLHIHENTQAVAAHSFTVILGILLLIKLSGIICKNSEEKPPVLLRTIATYSFFIYVSHDFVQTVLKKIAAKVLIQNDAIQMIEYFLIPIFTCVVCISAAAILRKIARPVYSIMTGARK